jgi:hypothetical protein
MWRIAWRASQEHRRDGLDFTPLDPDFFVLGLVFFVLISDLTTMATLYQGHILRNTYRAMDRVNNMSSKTNTPFPNGGGSVS